MTETLKSYSKINLALALHGKRADGYHELQTLMHEVDLFDEIKVSLSQLKEDSLSIEGTHLDIHKDNLIIKALSKLREHRPTTPYFNIHLKKNIPIGGGMGGGSSNAITILLYAAKQLSIKEPELIDKIASELGSDTNFFINGKTSICCGRGEQIKPVDYPKTFFNVLCPVIQCSTINVFKKCTSDHYSQRSLEITDLQKQITPFNDLEKPCYLAYPEMEYLSIKFKEIFLGINLSGSGSTLYTMHQDELTRDTTYKKLKAISDNEGVKILKTQSAERTTTLN